MSIRELLDSPVDWIKVVLDGLTGATALAAPLWLIYLQWGGTAVMVVLGVLTVLYRYRVARYDWEQRKKQKLSYDTETEDSSGDSGGWPRARGGDDPGLRG